jgi:uncharacterized membrane protein YhdT
VDPLITVIARAKRNSWRPLLESTVHRLSERYKTLQSLHTLYLCTAYNSRNEPSITDLALSFEMEMHCVYCLAHTFLVLCIVNKMLRAYLVFLFK